MSRTESNWRSDWRNVGRACDTWYCILIIKFYIEPGFPEIQAGKRLWSTRWRRKTAHWNADILKDRGLRMLLIRRARKVSNRVSSYLSGFQLTYWDTMTGTSSNDRLLLHQNGEINSNEYFSYNVFSGMKSSTTWNGNAIAQSPRKFRDISIYDLLWFIERSLM